jgi:transposase
MGWLPDRLPTACEIFGAGPVIAGTIIGDAGDISRFASRDHFAAYDGTAPVEVSPGGRITRRLPLRGNRRINHAIHTAAITQIRNRHSDGRACCDRKIAEGKTHKERSGRSSGGSATPSTPGSGPTPARPPQRPRRAREGNRGTTLTPARSARTPNTSSSDKPLPDPQPAYGPPPPASQPCRRSRLQRKPGKALDSKEDSPFHNPALFSSKG